MCVCVCVCVCVFLCIPTLTSQQKTTVNALSLSKYIVMVLCPLVL